MILLYGCDWQPLPSSMSNTLGEIHSRGIITDTSLEKGSTALFSASGGNSFVNQIFTFDGSNWTNENVTLATNTPQATSLTALYPAYNDSHTLIPENPYTEGALEDVLIAQATFTDQTNIDLSFTHLFSMLTIHVQSPFKESLTSVSLKAPKVTGINATERMFTTTGEHTTHLDKSDSGDYTFIIPSIEHCNLTLTFTFDDEEEVSHPLTHTFEEGHKYECNVTGADTRPGIRTIDDLIDFSLLINGKYTGNRTLAEFGEVTDEGMVYHLLEDLDFENKTYSKLLPIGYAYSNSSIFNAIFDGGGHTISNLVIPDKTTNSNVQTNFSGLFGHIGENGIVRNLHLNNANSLKSPSCKNIGGIAAKNSGLIINCSVQNSTFYALEDTYIGNICSRLSQGYIINCYTLSDTIYCNKRTYTGGIAGDANGYILNCYTYKNYFDVSKSIEASKNGGLVGNNSPNYKLSIANCYVYHLRFNNTYSGIAVGLAQNVNIDNFMYNIGSYVCREQTANVSISNDQKYESYKVNGTHISSILNDWIDNPDRTEYKDIAFKHWTNTNPPVFAE